MSNYKVEGNIVYFKELHKDTLGTNFRVAEVQDWKPVKHMLLCQTSKKITGQPEMWKRVRILLEGIRKSNIPFLYSPNKIVQYEDQVELLYDYLQGCTLEQMLTDADKRSMPISFDLTFSIALAIADVIEIGSSIIVSGEKSFHGFLTPDNIFINYDGKIYLKNYGIFPYIEKSDALCSDLEVRYGAWLSPEFVKRQKLLPQSDIYHLGYIIYKILTGKYFSYSAGEDFDSKFVNLSFKQYIPSTDKNFLEGIITFFKRTLNPDPNKRFRSIKEFREYISGQFHIEELSSASFNLAYFMNSLYGEAIEEESKVMLQELSYRVPKPAVEQTPAKDDRLVYELLEGLDKQSKTKRPIYIAVAILSVVLAVIAILYLSQSSKSKEEAQRLQQQEAKLKQEKEQTQKEYEAKLKKIQDDRQKEIEASEQKLKEMSENNKKLETENKKSAQKESQRLIEEEQARLNKLKDEQDKAKKEQEEKDRLAAIEKQKEEDRKNKEAAAVEATRKVEAAKAKLGQEIAFQDAEVKPILKAGDFAKWDDFNSVLRRKYFGKRYTFRLQIQVDENGDPTKVNVSGISGGSGSADIPDEVKTEIINVVKKNYKFTPAMKDGVRVKVWFPIKIINIEMAVSGKSRT
jgi:hypothetical protein